MSAQLPVRSSALPRHSSKQAPSSSIAESAIPIASAAAHAPAEEKDQDRGAAVVTHGGAADRASRGAAEPLQADRKPHEIEADQDGEGRDDPDQPHRARARLYEEHGAEDDRQQAGKAEEP